MLCFSLPFRATHQLASVHFYKRLMAAHRGASSRLCSEKKPEQWTPVAGCP